MFTLNVPEEMLEKLRSMREEEEDFIRLREYKLGGGCSSKFILGLGIDEFDEDEDEKIDVQGVPFIAEKDFLLKHGHSFELSFNQNKEVLLNVTESDM